VILERLKLFFNSLFLKETTKNGIENNYLNKRRKRKNKRNIILNIDTTIKSKGASLMKRLSKGGLIFTSAFISLTGLLLFASCSNESPLSNDNLVSKKVAQSDIGEITFLNVDQSKLAYLDKEAADGITFRSRKLIETKKGGKIMVGNRKVGKSVIEFEKNDLPYNTPIEFEWAANETIDGAFRPCGIYFNKPVRVEFSYKLAEIDGVNENDLRIFYFNKDKGIWEFKGGTVDTKEKIVTTYLKHFSRYAVAYGR
jgi:hypothetical protein